MFMLCVLLGFPGIRLQLELPTQFSLQKKQAHTTMAAVSITCARECRRRVMADILLRQTLQLQQQKKRIRQDRSDGFHQHHSCSHPARVCVPSLREVELLTSISVD